LIEVWDGVVGTARERIENHLNEILGGPADPDLVTHVFRCISGSAAQRHRHSGDHMYYFDDVLARIRASANVSPAALRCECCGYHFRAKDIANNRVRTVLDAGFIFDKYLFPGRSTDSYKPIIRGKDDSLTRLSVDHIVPQETLGWSEADNLEVL